jgi:hypothetical protein
VSDATDDDGEVRLEPRPTAVNPGKLGFIIYLEDMKRLQIIHLNDRGGVADACHLWLSARELGALAYLAVRPSSSGVFRLICIKINL